MPRFLTRIYFWSFVAVLVGAATGLGIYTFVYARGYSYLLSDPAVCANCHVMQPHYDAWLKGGHKIGATCNDCHTPHNIVGKYVVKGINGFNHSLKFTTGNYPDILRANAMNHWVTERACRHCHQDVVDAIDTDDKKAHAGLGPEVSCIRCHRFVGHDL